MPNDVAFALDTTLHSSAQANGNGATFNVGGLTGVTLQVTGTFSANLYPEGTLDGSTWPSPGLIAINLATGQTATTITAAGLYFVPVPGIDQFRLRIGSYVSGAVTVTAKGLAVTSPFLLAAPAPAGGTPAAQDLRQVGGTTLALGQAAAAASIPVVIASNQSNLPTSGAADVTAAVSISGQGTGAQVACAGLQSVGVVLTGSWTATLKAQVSADGGTTWRDTQFYDQSTQAFSSTVTANGTYQIVGTGGMSHARVVAPVSAVASFSGTVGGTIRASSQAGDVGTVQLAGTGQSTRSASVPVALARDQYTAPSQLNANSDAPTLQPAGGAGPLALVPVSDLVQQQQLDTVIRLLDKLTLILSAALTP